MNKILRDYLLTATATFILLIWILPLIWAVVVSLKSEIEVLAYPPNIIFNPTLNNFKDAIYGSLSIISELGDSFLIASIVTLLTLILSIPAAYSLARLDLFGKKKNRVLCSCNSNDSSDGFSNSILFNFRKLWMA
jgi:multiple sugar transport system permease protein